MANFVMNKVCVSGSKKDIDALIDYMKQGNRKELDFNVFDPMPECLNIDAPVDNMFLAVGEYLVNKTLQTMDKESYYGTVADAMRLSVKKQIGKEVEDKEELIKVYIAVLNGKMSKEDFNKKMAYSRRAYMNLVFYGYSNWYDWCRNHWGTKWNACDATPLEDLSPFYDEDTEQWTLEFEFQTAWNAPVPILEKISELFPKLSGVVDYADECYGENTGMIYFEKGDVSVDALENNSHMALTHSLGVWDIEDYEEYAKQDENGNWYVDYNDFWDSDEED